MQIIWQAIWPTVRTRTGTAPQGQSEPRSNGNDGVAHTSQICNSGASSPIVIHCHIRTSLLLGWGLNPVQRIQPEYSKLQVQIGCWQGSAKPNILFFSFMHVSSFCLWKFVIINVDISGLCETNSIIIKNDLFFKCNLTIGFAVLNQWLYTFKSEMYDWIQRFIRLFRNPFSQGNEIIILKF